MEKKYLIGYMFGRPFLRFDDVKNFKEEADANGDVHVTFEDKDGAYHYVSGGRGFREVDNKAPEIERYQVRGRRTIKRNGLDKAMVEVNPEEYQERRNRVEPEQVEEDDFIELADDGQYDDEVDHVVYPKDDEDDLDYNYIDNNDTGYVGEDFLDELLVDAPIEQVMEEEEISSPEELLGYYVASLEEGGIGISDEYKEMLLDKIKNALED